MVGRLWLVPLPLCYSEQGPLPLWSSDSGWIDPEELSSFPLSQLLLVKHPRGPQGCLHGKNPELLAPQAVLIDAGVMGSTLPS